MSHLKGAGGGTRGAGTPNCARAKSNPGKEVSEVLREGQQNPKHASNEMFCAAHLSTLCNEALRRARNSGGLGKLVNYEVRLGLGVARCGVHLF